MFKDLFGLKRIKRENEALRNAIGEENVDGLLNFDELFKSREKELHKIEKNIEISNDQLYGLSEKLDGLRGELVQVEDQLMLESFALYTPKYDFENSDEYKEKLDEIRQKQKQLVKNKHAVLGNQNWTVNGKKSEGKKMVNDMIKLVLRSFNNECDTCIMKVKFNNVESCEKKINKSFDTLNKLGRVMNVEITDVYKRLKFKELYLAHEYKVKKEEEKEEQRRLREELREEARLKKEIEEARKEFNKEKKHYNKALSDLHKKLDKSSDAEEKRELEIKINEVQEKIQEIDKGIENIDYREANKRAGYVYVISNIGSFGEGVYKIGMTRRLEPMDRVKELGDASVPFNFDVHAMIFSDDAPTLENKLHKAFEDKKMNMVNSRREFFKVDLLEIKNIIKENHDKTVEFNELALAEQYRESLIIRGN